MATWPAYDKYFPRRPLYCTLNSVTEFLSVARLEGQGSSRRGADRHTLERIGELQPQVVGASDPVEVRGGGAAHEVVAVPTPVQLHRSYEERREALMIEIVAAVWIARPLLYTSTAPPVAENRCQTTH